MASAKCQKQIARTSLLSCCHTGISGNLPLLPPFFPSYLRRLGHLTSCLSANMVVASREERAQWREHWNACMGRREREGDRERGRGRGREEGQRERKRERERERKKRERERERENPRRRDSAAPLQLPYNFTRVLVAKRLALLMPPLSLLQFVFLVIRVAPRVVTRGRGSLDPGRWSDRMAPRWIYKHIYM